MPGELIGQRVEARADSCLVKIYSRGQLVKTHPRKPPGGRSTDPADYPVGQAEYALRDVATLTKKAAAAGPSVGVYATRLLDMPLPWTRMRSVYRLLGLARSYGAGNRRRRVRPRAWTSTSWTCARSPACSSKPPNASHHRPAARVVGGPARFARDNTEYQTDYQAGRP